MGRNKNGDSRKAQGREALLDKYPSCVQNSLYDSTPPFDLIVEDTIRNIQSLNPEKESKITTTSHFMSSHNVTDTFLANPQFGNDGRTGACLMSEFIESIKKTCETEFNSPTKNVNRNVVMCFDKANVSLAKAPTQRKRRNALEGQGRGLFIKEIIKKTGLSNIVGWKHIKVTIHNVSYSNNMKVVKTISKIETTLSEFRFRKLVSGQGIVFLFVTSPIDEKQLEIQFREEYFKECVLHSLTQSSTKASLSIGIKWSDTIIDFIPECKVSSREMEDKVPFESLLDLNKQIPVDWRDYFFRQAHTRAKFLRFVCLQLLLPNSPVSLKCDRNTKGKLIIDGHHFTKKEFMELGIYNESELEKVFHNCPWIIDEPHWPNFPISVSFDQSTGERKIEIEEQLYNNIGETDFTAFFYVSILKSKHVKFITADTDWIYYSLIYQHKYQTLNKFVPETMFTYRTKIGALNIQQNVSSSKKRNHSEIDSPCEDQSLNNDNDDTDGPPIKKAKNNEDCVNDITIQNTIKPKRKVTHEWIDLIQLYNSIHNDPILKKQDLEGQQCYVVPVTLLAAGSDYTYPFYYVNHKSFLNALYDYGQYLGKPLCKLSKMDYRYVDFYFYANNSNNRYIIYKKLLLFAYAKAFKLKEDDFLALFPTASSKNDLAFKNFQQKITNLVANKNKTDTKKHFPSEKDCKYSAAQLQYYLHLLVHLGDAYIPVNLYLRNYAYNSSEDEVSIEPQDVVENDFDDDDVPILTYETIERMCIET